MRVSDAHRERTVALLGERRREGYLSDDTLEQRVRLVHVAKTTDELAVLTRDLPPRHPRLAALRRVVLHEDDPQPAPPLRRLAPPPELGDGPLLVGRDPECDLLVDDAAVSGRHLHLRRSGENWTLTDLGSRNGTRVNGWRVSSVRLRRGDRIEIGGSRFVFEPPAQ
jgi:hypothetical protein